MEYMLFLVLAVVLFGFFLKAIRKSPPTERAIITATTSDDEEKDNFEKFPFATARILPACGRYRIKYTDQRGLTSERDITVKRAFEADGKYAIDAHCHMRDAHRSFIDDRITGAVDRETGEVVSSVALHSIDMYSKSGPGKAWKVIGELWKPVAILLFVCRADGRMMKAERNIIAEYIKSQYPESELDDTSLDAALKEMATPDHKDFRRLVAELRNDDPAQLPLLLDIATRIVGTQKSVDPMETAALEILRSAAS